MQDKVRRDHGLSHALAGFLTLEKLGLKALPMTPNGKVKKADLKTIVIEHLKSIDHPIPTLRKTPKEKFRAHSYLCGQRFWQWRKRVFHLMSQ